MQANYLKNKKGGRELCGLPAKKYEKEKDCLAFVLLSTVNNIVKKCVHCVKGK